MNNRADSREPKRELTFADLERAWKNFDWEAHNQRIVWILNEPICCCKSCYSNWFEWGKKVYKDDLRGYEKREKEALIHLRNKQESRRIDEENRARERNPRYFCSAVA